MNVNTPFCVIPANCVLKENYLERLQELKQGREKYIFAKEG